MASDTSKTAKITKRWLPTSTSPKYQIKMSMCCWVMSPFFKHLYLQFYYISVAVTLFRVRSTWYNVRGMHNFWGAPIAQPATTKFGTVLKLLLQLTVRTACTTIQAVVVYSSTSCCISQCPVHYPVKFDAVIFILSGVIDNFSFHIT